MTDNIVAAIPSVKTTDEQLTCVLEAIAGKADTVQRLCWDALQAVNQGETAHGSQLLSAAESIVSQIGWLADVHGGDYKGGAKEWMLFPVYHPGQPASS